jgi:hypothetical protein
VCWNIEEESWLDSWQGQETSSLVQVFTQPSTHLGGSMDIFLGPPVYLLLLASAQANSTPSKALWCAQGYPRPCQDEDYRQAVVNTVIKFLFP